MQSCLATSAWSSAKGFFRGRLSELRLRTRKADGTLIKFTRFDLGQRGWKPLAEACARRVLLGLLRNLVRQWWYGRIVLLETSKNRQPFDILRERATTSSRSLRRLNVQRVFCRIVHHVLSPWRGSSRPLSLNRRIFKALLAR